MLAALLVNDSSGCLEECFFQTVCCYGFPYLFLGYQIVHTCKHQICELKEMHHNLAEGVSKEVLYETRFTDFDSIQKFKIEHERFQHINCRIR